MQTPFRTVVCGIDELAGHREARVTHVLSILDPGWPIPEAFGSFGDHAKLELRFNDAIDPGPGVVLPDRADVDRLLAFGRGLGAGDSLLVHCHAGVSRSSAAMALLVAQAVPDASGQDVFAEIVRIRPQIWPNLRIVELGDAALGRDGELVAGASGVYRAQMERTPGLDAQFRLGGRGREVDAASA